MTLLLAVFGLVVVGLIGLGYRSPRARHWIPLIVFLLGCAAYWHTMADDAFISFRYSEHLAQGQGLVFNLGDREEGYSNPLWVLLLAGTSLLDLNIVITSKILAAIAMCTVIVLLGRALRKTTTSPGISYLLLNLFAFSSSTIFWTMSGMETPLYAALLTIGVLALVQESELMPPVVRWRSAWPLSGILFGLLAITRTEGIGMVAVAALFVGVFWWKRRHLSLWRWLAAAFVPWVAVLLFRLYYFGMWLPLPTIAKVRHIDPDRILLGITSLGTLYHLLPLFVLLIAAIILAFMRYKQQKAQAVLALVIAIVAASQIVFAVRVESHWFSLGRFLLPGYPLLIFAAALGWQYVWEYIPNAWRRFSTTGISAILLVAVGYAAATLPLHLYLVTWGVSLTPTGMFAQCLREQDFPRVPVGFEDIGIFTYYSNVPLVDDHGLIHRDVAAFNHNAYPGDTNEQRLARMELMLKRNPQYFIGPLYSTETPPIHADDDYIKNNQVPRQIFPDDVKWQYAGTLLGRPTQLSLGEKGRYLLTFAREGTQVHPAWPACITKTHERLHIDLDHAPLMVPLRITGQREIDEVLWLRKNALRLYAQAH